MENKTTLWDKLNPNYKEQIERFWCDKPMLLKSIKNEMSMTSWYNELKYSTIKNIYYPCFGMFEEISEMNLVKLFN